MSNLSRAISKGLLDSDPPSLAQEECSLQKIYVPNWHTALVHAALLEDALVTREIQRMHTAEVNWLTHGLQSFMLAAIKPFWLKSQKLF